MVGTVRRTARIENANASPLFIVSGWLSEKSRIPKRARGEELEFTLICVIGQFHINRRWRDRTQSTRADTEF